MTINVHDKLKILFNTRSESIPIHDLNKILGITYYCGILSSLCFSDILFTDNIHENVAKLLAYYMSL